MDKSSNKNHYRFPFNIVRKIEERKFFQSHLNILQHADQNVDVHIFTSHWFDSHETISVSSNKIIPISPLKIEQIYINYTQTQSESIWMTCGHEALRSNKQLDDIGRCFTSIGLVTEGCSSETPQSYVGEFQGPQFKLLTPKALESKTEQTPFWSLATRTLHPEKYELLKFEVPIQSIRSDFQKILDWGTQCGVNSEFVTLASPSPAIHMLHPKTQSPDWEYGWAPATTFLNWLESDNLFIDFSTPHKIKGYLCRLNS